jgi:hypothetical protein
MQCRGLFHLNPPLFWISLANPVVPTNEKAFAKAMAFLFRSGASLLA